MRYLVFTVMILFAGGLVAQASWRPQPGLTSRTRAAGAYDPVRAETILFGGDLAGVSESTFNEIVGEVPTKEVEKTKLDGAGLPLVELLVHAGLSPSKGQARKDVEGGGVNINNVREANFQRAVTSNDLLFGKHVLLRKGKKNYVRLVLTP